jgi:hypothetical protein
MTVSGDPQTVSLFIEQAKADDTVLDFEKFVPVHQDLRIDKVYANTITPDIALLHKQYKANIEKHGFETWYDFCIEKWGTKWNASHAMLGEPTEKDKDAYYEFNTAWASPDAIIKAMSKAYPTLSFEVTSDEEGHDFYYTKCYKGGEQVTHEDLERSEFND